MGKSVSRLYITGFVFMLLNQGCEPELPVEATPDSFNFSETVINYNYIEKSIYIHARVSALEGIDRVFAVLTEPNDSIQYIALNDNNLQGDVIAGDGIYSYAYIYNFRDGFSGEISVDVQAEDTKGNISDIFTFMENFKVSTGPPVILEIDTPDSVALPQNNDIKYLTLKAVVDDPDGIEDIVSVTYEFWKIADSTWVSFASFQLLDIDPVEESNNLVQDGYFTGRVELYSTNRPVMTKFRYKAKDKSGAFSEFVLDSIQMYDSSMVGMKISSLKDQNTINLPLLTGGEQ